MESINEISIILVFCLVFLMFGMGTTLCVDDFKRLVNAPKAVTLGLINQVIFVPLIGLCIAAFIDLPFEVAVGIVIITACPGGPLSNMISFLAKGDVALSITLTALSTSISLISLPIWLSLALSALQADSMNSTFSFSSTVIQIALTTLFPAILGMCFSAIWPKISIRIEKIARSISMVFLVAAIIGFNISNPDTLLDNLSSLVLFGFILNALMMLVGYTNSRVVSLPGNQPRTIAIETGFQNIPLAISIATIQLNSLEVALMPIIYGFCQLFSGILLIVAIKVKDLMPMNYARNKI